MLKKKLLMAYLRIVNKGKVKFDLGASVSRQSHFEGCNYIGKNTVFSGNMGYGSYIGENTKLSALIGKYSCVAANVVSINGFHPTSKFVSIHPVFYSKSNCTGISYAKRPSFNEFKYADETNKYDVVIGNDVWVGYGTIILAGVTIGDGAIIGAGAVVTNNIEPYSIVGGVPARSIRQRFESEEIEYLLNLKWWNKDSNWITRYSSLFDDINKLRNLESHE